MSAYYMSSPRGNYVVNSKGEILVGKPNFVYGTVQGYFSPQWKLYGLSERWNSSPILFEKLKEKMDRGETVEGYVHDIDHGTRRFWGGGKRLPKAKMYLDRSLKVNSPMKKKTRKKKVVRRKRRSMSEKRVMQIKRGLMKSAKKLRLGAKRTGAYVYGTLRRIVGNPAIPASMNNPDYVKARRKAEQISKQYKRPYAIYASERNGKWVFRVAKYGLSFGDELVDIFNSQLVRKNPIRSSFDKPTFGPFNTETRRVNTTTMAGMREAEKLRRAGWYQGPVTLFSTTYYRQSALPKSSIARQIRGNPGEQRYTVDADRRKNYSLAEARRIAEERTRRFGMRGIYRSSSIFPYKKPVRANPPMYAHGMMSHRTHGLSLKQMMKLYRLVSSGNQKAVMFARRTLGIPMSESLSQVKAVVYHHILDLKGKI